MTTPRSRINMKKSMIPSMLTFLLTSSTTHGAIIRSLDEMKVLEVPISQEGLTRIKVQNDRILHVFGNRGEYVLETDETQGQIFIRPMLLPREDLKHSPSIPLTLTTEAGFTQDLRLIPSHQAPETLILKVDTELAQELAKEKRLPLFREEVEEVIQACREERIPLGYKEVPLSLSTVEGPYLLRREIQGQKLRGLTYRAQNNSSEVLVLSEPELAHHILSRGKDKITRENRSSPLIALLISKKTLNPGEGTDVYVVVRAN